MTPVLCCCEPENLIGFLPPDSPLRARTFVDPDGTRGVAFESHPYPAGVIAKMRGFIAAGRGKKRKKGRTWEKRR